MATSQCTETVSLIATAALSIYTFAKADTTARQVVVADDETGVQYIVAQDVGAGEVVPLVKPDGCVAKITLGATLTPGVPVMPGTDGKAVAATGVDAIWAGFLLEGGDADEIVEMIFSPLRGVSA